VSIGVFWHEWASLKRERNERFKGPRYLFFQSFKVDLNDFIKNNVCISGVNGDFGPLEFIFPRPFGPRAYNSATGQNRLLHALNTKISIWNKYYKMVFLHFLFEHSCSLKFFNFLLSSIVFEFSKYQRKTNKTEILNVK
jgi:hypothetical protein